jgi:hypothetical protein
MLPAPKALASLTLIALSAACAAPPAQTPNEPGISFPTTLGEGSPQPGKEPRPPPPPFDPYAEGRASAASSANAAPSASAAAPVQSASPTSEPIDPAQSPPDPEPLRMAEQWEYQISSHDGALSVVSVKAVNLAKPVVTPRRIGRYAIELWIGRELVERVRFDLPLLGGEEATGTTQKRALPPPKLEKGVHARTSVLIPRSPRARRAVLVDRAAGRAVSLPWPPDRSPTGQ